MAADRFTPAPNPARQMRIVATSLLVVMAGVFVAARAFDDAYPWLSYVRAFAEAAMVGGLADWFAVTALFRHPLGVPIPHTAIIPRNKDRIAGTLGSFLRQNFLTPVVVARRLEAFDIAAAAGKWLSAPRRTGRTRGGLAKLVRQLLDAFGDEAIGGLVRNAVAARLRAMEVSPLLGSALEGMVEGSRHEPLLDSAIRWASRMVDEHEHTIRGAVRERTAWFLRLAAVDEKVSDNLIKAIRNLLNEVAGDPQHPIRQRVVQGLRDFAFDLKHLPETRTKAEALKNELIENPAVGQYLEGLWLGLRATIDRAISDPNAALAGRLGEAARKLGETLEADARLRGAINLYVRRAIVGLVAEYGDEITRLVSDTIRSWDARTVTTRIETAVGRDLQYIRINGTLIGGLVGLTIHAVSEFL